jgi:ferrous iron transport protein B
MAAIVVSGIILKKVRLFAGEPSPFVMELPAYHFPSPKNVLLHMWDRVKAFVRKAGTVILLATVLVWLLSTFNWRFQMVDLEQSMLAVIGNAIAPLFAPLGWGNWKAAVATVTGLIAKENVVGTFGILYGFSEVAEDGQEVWQSLQASFTQLSGYTFLMFNLLCAPCFAAIGAVRNEMGSAKWTWFSVGYQCVFAYVVSLITYQLGMAFSGGGFGVGTVVAIILTVALIYLLCRKVSDPNELGGSVKKKAAI